MKGVLHFVHVVSNTKKVQITRMISLLLHCHHLAYCLMVYSFQKTGAITRKAKDIQYNNIHRLQLNNLCCGKWSLKY